MQKLTLSEHQVDDPANGLAIDDTLRTSKQTSDSQQFSYSPTEGSMKKNTSTAVALILISAIIAGIASGYGIFTVKKSQSGALSSEELQKIQAAPTGDIKVDDIYGSKNETDFKDSAEGVLQAGGIDGEGSHHIVRPGGKSQTVYLTSSTVDLDLLVGHKVKVWGETFSAQKAGWLMDVGRVKVLELNAALPTEK